VSQLASEARIDADEALVALWDAGFDEIEGRNHALGRRDLNRARRALGIATRRELKTAAYWMKLLDLDQAHFADLLQRLDVPVSGQSQTLTQKAISRLKSEAWRRQINPITGLAGPPALPRKSPPTPVFKWRTPGHRRALRWLSEEEVQAIHFELVADFSSTDDPIEPAGVRSESLLGSAVFRPMTSLGETLKYPTVETAAAALLHSITQDHPFHNGNKRTALVSMLVFLDENGLFPNFNQDQAFKLVLQVAQHRIVRFQDGEIADREVLAIADWLCDHCRPIEKGNRPITFRKLRQILCAYECQFEVTSGSKVNISRSVRVGPKILRRVNTLRTQVSYSDEGRDVAKNTVKKIRRDLRLDDEHGIDSHRFYGKDSISTVDFITRYRKTLHRLAKF